MNPKHYKTPPRKSQPQDLKKIVDVLTEEARERTAAVLKLERERDEFKEAADLRGNAIRANHKEIVRLAAELTEEQAELAKAECAWVFLAGLIRRVSGLPFWMFVTLQFQDWRSIKKTIDKKWPVANKPEAPVDDSGRL